jgi:hypothetical protein
LIGVRFKPDRAYGRGRSVIIPVTRRIGGYGVRQDAGIFKNDREQIVAACIDTGNEINEEGIAYDRIIDK